MLALRSEIVIVLDLVLVLGLFIIGARHAISPTRFPRSPTLPRWVVPLPTAVHRAEERARSCKLLALRSEIVIVLDLVLVLGLFIIGARHAISPTRFPRSPTLPRWVVPLPTATSRATYAADRWQHIKYSSRHGKH